MRKRKNNKQPPREAELSADGVQFENIEDKKENGTNSESKSLESNATTTVTNTMKRNATSLKDNLHSILGNETNQTKEEDDSQENTSQQNGNPYSPSNQFRVKQPLISMCITPLMIDMCRTALMMQELEREEAGAPL